MVIEGEVGKMKKLLVIFLCLSVFLPTSVNASNGYLNKDSIITCDGIRYGYHGADKHWHQATDDGKAKGSNLGTDWTCNKNNKVSVNLVDCVDGDTAKFDLNGEVITTRFLAVDTPETKHPTKGVEPFGPEASEYTCNALKGANSISLEYDNGSTKTDKYGRHLVWVWADGKLLQKSLVEQGLARIAYLYGDYKYTKELLEDEQKARAQTVNIWSQEGDSSYEITDEGDDEKVDEEEILEETLEDDMDKAPEKASEVDLEDILTFIGLTILLIILIIRLIRNNVEVDMEGKPIKKTKKKTQKKKIR